MSHKNSDCSRFRKDACRMERCPNWHTCEIMWSGSVKDDESPEGMTKLDYDDSEFD